MMASFIFSAVAHGEQDRMVHHESGAAAEFRKMLKWIGLAAVLMVIVALAYLKAMGSVTVHTVAATILGVLFSVLLGCGLFALAFFSSKSGHDDDVNSAAGHKQSDKD